MASFNYYQPHSTLSWTITHNLNTSFIIMDVFEDVGGESYRLKKTGIASIQIVDNNTIIATFSSPTAGRARLVA